jgi:hypothetical protein
MAAAVEQNDVAGRDFFDGGDRFVESEAVVLGVEVGKALRRYARRGEDLRMIGPRGLRHPHGCLG